MLAVLRAEGVPFEDAWPDAIRFALVGVSHGGRTWRASFAWSDEVWRLAYERRSARREGRAGPGVDH